MNRKKGILAVSSGTAYPDAIEYNIEPCEKKIAGAFQEYDVRRAFTSVPVLKKLKEKEGIHIDDPAEALDKLYYDKYTEIIVQPLHVLPGDEFHEKIVKISALYREKFKEIAVGRPLLSGMKDYQLVIEAIKNQAADLSGGEAAVFMGHGTAHPANAAYSCLQMMMEDRGVPVYVGTIDFYPELKDIIPRLKKNGVKKVTLMPLMLAAGGHARNDMAGEDENSWKSILNGEGFSVKVHLHGLGENPAIQEIFVQHVRDVIENRG